MSDAEEKTLLDDLSEMRGQILPDAVLLARIAELVAKRFVQEYSGVVICSGDKLTFTYTLNLQPVALENADEPSFVSM